MTSKKRLDQLMVEQGLAESRTQAQALILAGKVMDANRQLLLKAGQQFLDSMELQLKEKLHPWVSRGGMKLAHALDVFSIDLSGLTVIDVGASTGGFTDVLLQQGASKIYAVDVGYGQLAEKLRQDARVINLEKTNARYLTREQIPEPLDALVCDASFISLKTVLPAAMDLVKPSGWLVALIKPQFEVGRGKVGKGGVVGDPALHETVCADITEWFDAQLEWKVQALAESPITGPKGNKEFLIYATKHGA